MHHAAFEGEQHLSGVSVILILLDGIVHILLGQLVLQFKGVPFANTKESGLEALIAKWIVDYNGYEEGTNADYSKEYALDEIYIKRSISSSSTMRTLKQAVESFWCNEVSP